jgi:2-oxoglutarate ferredoxin oxidoreductase subunit alpha
MAKKLMKGNEAIGEAAIAAGCRAYFCYPITPQNEVGEYLSKRMNEVGGAFLQGESELAVSYMIFGAAGAGAKVFTTSSSPGISLMSEALSYIAMAEIPSVFVNIMRAGPGLGGILPGQADYFQATKGGGHGDYRLYVLAPSSVQEAVDLMILGFEMAEKYRNPVMILGDGMTGQMMEPVELPEVYSERHTWAGQEDWATTGATGRERHLLNSLALDPQRGFERNQRLAAKYRRMEEEDLRYEEVGTEGPLDVLLVSYGTMARIAKTAMQELQAQGLKVGMLRPITLYPFPLKRIRELASTTKLVVSVEISMGQMVEDVERAVAERARVAHYGTAGGIVPTPAQVAEGVRKLLEDGNG